MNDEPISPPAQPVFVQQIDESRLPKGQCRYILLNPEVKGQRCGCVCFTLNHDHPGVTCNCGHQSCYHIQTQDAVMDTHEVEKLRHRVKALEELLDRENQRGLGKDLSLILKRLGDLEEMVEKSKDEFTSDIKGCHRNITRAWQAVDEVAKRQTLQDTMTDERFDDHADNLTRLDHRFRELNEISISLDERVESLEDLEYVHETMQRELPDSIDAHLEDLSRTKNAEIETRNVATTVVPSSATVPPRASSQDWTVHVSLLPSTSITRPFPKDSRNYKRCLSRGLHQMVAVSSHSGEGFSKAVVKAFGHILNGQEWTPFERNGTSVSGLPNLKPLDTAVAKPENYTYSFLKENCGVVTADGKIDSLYIAPRNTELSWNRLRSGPVYLAGLEDCWKDLDATEETSNKNDDGIWQPNPSRKRPSTDISADDGSEELPPTSISTPDATAQSQPSSDYGDGMSDLGRATKVQRTSFDLPMPMKLRVRRETAASA